MEKKVYKHYKRKFLITMFGFLTGSILYGLMGGEAASLRFLSGVVAGGIFWILSDFYKFRKHPNLKDKINIEDKDERNQLIQAKAALFAYTVTIIILFVIVFIGAVMEDPLISYGTSVLLLFLILVFWIATRYWNKKL